MASIHTVLDAVINHGTSGKRVQVPVDTRGEYETIRTRLVTLWTNHRTAIIAITDDDPLADLSLCADWSATSKTATFYLGKPRRKLAKSYSFSIVDETPSAPALGEPANDETIVTPKLAE